MKTLKKPTPKTSTRAGTYHFQPTGYRAFIPSPLPPIPPLRIQHHLQALLSQADRSLGRLDGCVLTLPNPDLFVFMYVRKEAVLSSQIEGTQSSLQDLLAAEAKLFGPLPSDVDEVVNYVAAMHHGLARLNHLPVSVRLIREIHQELMRGVRGSHLTPGELRKTQHWIGPGGCTLNDASFIPPPPEHVPQALGELEKFLHTQDQLPALIRIGLAHVQFETIHPFQAVRDRGDWEGWLRFFLQGVIEVSTEAADTARRILALREEHRTLITEHLGRAAGSAHKLLESLFDRPIVSITDVKSMTNTTYAAANNLVSRLESLGILQEITGMTRNRRFRYEPYVRLFIDT